MAELVRVEFTGEGSGTEELTWGQRAIWHSWHTTGIAEWDGGVMPLAEGMTVEKMATLLEFMMIRHQSLRTRFRIDEDGTIWQTVSESGEIELEVIDIDEADDPAAIAQTTFKRQEDTPYVAEHDWPVRMAVLRRDGFAIYMAVNYSHLVVDGGGVDAIIADLPNLETGAGPHANLPTGITPLEQARWQQSPAGKRQSASSIRAWRRQLEAITPTRFDPSGEQQELRWWESRYTSPAGHLALTSIAHRTEVHSGTVLLAAYAVALAEVSGKNPSMMRILVNNRFRPTYAESVSSLVQSALCVVDVRDKSFDEAIAAAWKAQLSAGLHAYYEPRDLWALLDRVTEERGTDLDLMCYFNDRRRSLAQGPMGDLPTEEQVRAALPLSTFRQVAQRPEDASTCYLHINSVPDTLDYELKVDTYSVSPAQQEAILRGIEAILVRAAFDPEAPCLLDAAVAAA